MYLWKDQSWQINKIDISKAKLLKLNKNPWFWKSNLEYLWKSYSYFDFKKWTLSFLIEKPKDPVKIINLIILCLFNYKR
jgi:hypothetical protein